MSRLKVFTPAGLSSFFEACIFDERGNLIENPEIKGARGGGFALEEGSLTEVKVSDESKEIKVYINGKREDAKTSKKAVELFLEKFGLKEIGVTVNHRIKLPVGAGFGTSASGALGAILALSFEIGKPISLIEALKLTHVAEVLSYTGLGTSEGFATGGVVLITKPGALWEGKVEKILYDKDIRIVAGFFEPISKENVLKSVDFLMEVNRVARLTMDKILQNPTVETLLKASREFAEKSGIGSNEILKIADELTKCGAIGATQNMIGKAVHCAVFKKKVDQIIKIIRQYTEKVYVSKIHEGGPLIYSN